ncbi:hypothetical protein OSB04_014605 [Centaurea solstitialis]|uniref:Reverse transcriptase RNase H-like domain-containing protein n=1 Tax=Centaurea solstitialis TaxID=347529 RepID=A0AA38SXE1_9ASTR|nr:hypothetical protein OSB04_014605 [Centaurea solstitialis]
MTYDALCIEDDALFRKNVLSIQKHDFKSKRINKVDNMRQNKSGKNNSVRYPELPTYNFAGTPKEIVNSLRNVEAKIRWPKKYDQPGKAKNRTTWFDFHDDHGHTTDNCISLRMKVDSTDDHEQVLQKLESSTAVSAAMVREEDKQQRPIYYVSKSLLDARTRYASMEKLLLGLVIVAKKLRHYFESHHTIVITNYPLKTVLRKPELTGRLTKWNIYLSGFDIEFKPKTAIKSQALADFVAEFSPGLEPTTCDEVHNATNNEAEYEALIAGLDIAYKLGARHLNARSDSLLIVNQVNGDFQAKDSKMMSYLKIVKNRADALTNLGSAFNEPTLESIPSIHLMTPTNKTKKKVPMNEEIYNWSLDIWNYLEHKQLLEDKKLKKQNLKLHSIRSLKINSIIHVWTSPTMHNE